MPRCRPRVARHGGGSTELLRDVDLCFGKSPHVD